MKTVRIDFAGPKSEDMARRFFSYLVDGGLEDQLIAALSEKGVTLEINDSNATDLAVLFQCREATMVIREAKNKLVSLKGVKK